MHKFRNIHVFESFENAHNFNSKKQMLTVSLHVQKLEWYQWNEIFGKVTVDVVVRYSKIISNRI